MNSSDLLDITQQLAGDPNSDLMRYGIRVEELFLAEEVTILPMFVADEPVETDPTVDRNVGETDIEVVEIPMEVIVYECPKGGNCCERVPLHRQRKGKAMRRSVAERLLPPPVRKVIECAIERAMKGY